MMNLTESYDYRSANGGFDMNILRRVERMETAITGNGIPNEERIQVIKGRMSEGHFLPADPDDSVRSRKEALTRRFGSAEEAVFVRLIDGFGPMASE